MIKKENDNFKNLVVKNYYIANLLLSTLIIVCLGHLLFFLFQLFPFSSFNWNGSLGEGGFVLLRLTLLYTPVLIVLWLIRLWMLRKCERNLENFQPSKIVGSLKIMTSMLLLSLNLYIIVYREVSIFLALAFVSLTIPLEILELIFWIKKLLNHKEPA